MLPMFSSVCGIQGTRTNRSWMILCAELGHGHFTGTETGIALELLFRAVHNLLERYAWLIPLFA